MKDDDWSPGSEDLPLETKKGEKESENGGELIDESKEEEDKMEDDDTPAVPGNDNANHL